MGFHAVERGQIAGADTVLVIGCGMIGVVIEAVGLLSTFRAAVHEVCFSGRVVYIVYAKEPVAYETKYFILKELDIRGSRNATARNVGHEQWVFAGTRLLTGQASLIVAYTGGESIYGQIARKNGGVTGRR